MRGLHVPILALALASPALAAQPPSALAPMPHSPAPAALVADPPAPAPAPSLVGPATAEWMAELRVANVPAGAALIWDVSPEDAATVRPVKNENALLIAGPAQAYKVKCRVVSFAGGTVDITELRQTVTLTGDQPAPGPVDPVNPVDPTDPKVKPRPAAKSFHVIFVFDSAALLSPEDRAVIYGKQVEDWLDANCTDGHAGWRRRDKAAPGESDPTMKALWEAVQPKVTATPCVAIERDGKVDIVNLGATPAKMVETLKGYKGGK